MNIRVAKQQDITVLIQMGEKLHLVEKQYEPLLTFSVSDAVKRYEEALNNDHSLLLIAEVDQVSVGYLYAHAQKVTSLDTSELECEVEVVFVEEKYRGNGVAQILIKECIEWAKILNVFRFKSGIFTQNEASQSVFQKLGFKPYHTEYILHTL